MKDFQGFQSWDETYVHTRHNTRGRTVLESSTPPGGTISAPGAIPASRISSSAASAGRPAATRPRPARTSITRR
jgi:hypothetical protein